MLLTDIGIFFFQEIGGERGYLTTNTLRTGLSLFSFSEIAAMLETVEESLTWTLDLIGPFSTHVTLNRNINYNQKWKIKHHFLFNMHINNKY